MIVHQHSMIGRRESNEDKHNSIKNLDNHNKSINNVNFFAIYDGHGGKKVSAYLSENLPSYFVNRRIKYPLKREYVNNVYDSVQSRLRIDHRDFSYRSGSTSLVVIQFKHKDEQYLNILNTGDCRAILCSNNIAVTLTKDHKPDKPEEKHRLFSKHGAKPIWDGRDWRIKDLSVSRAFGDVDAVPYITHRPDIFKYRLGKNDKFYILACDGLWDVVSSQEAVNFVLNSCYSDDLKGRSKKTCNVSKKLAEYAIKKGSMDNITAIVAFF